jgi:Mg-chelatase subunit ChlD
MQLSPLTTTLAVLLIDRSTSMRQFAAELKTGFASHLDALKASPEAERLAIAVWSFAGRGPRQEIRPIPVASVQGMGELTFQGGTPLYTSVVHVLEVLLRLPPNEQLKVVLNVLTDGDDRGSHPIDLPQIRHCLAPMALHRGFSLSVIGFGVDGVAIARGLGFTGNTSVAHPATKDGLKDSFERMTMNTTVTRG